eukprot:sb/3473851/
MATVLLTLKVVKRTTRRSRVGYKKAVIHTFGTSNESLLIFSNAKIVQSVWRKEPPGKAGWVIKKPLLKVHPMGALVRYSSPIISVRCKQVIKITRLQDYKITMGTGILKVIRKYRQTSTGSAKSVSNSFTALCPLTCFMKEHTVA